MKSRFFQTCLILFGVAIFAEAAPTIEALNAHIALRQNDLNVLNQKAEDLRQKILDRETQVLLPQKTQAIDEGLNWSDWEARRNWFEQNKIREHSIPGVGKSGERHLTDGTSVDWLEELKTISKNIRLLNNEINACSYGISCISFITQNQQVVNEILGKMQVKPGNQVWDEKSKTWKQLPSTRGTTTPQENALLNEYRKRVNFLNTNPLMRKIK